MLIVDDTAFNLMALQQVLKSMFKIEAETATDGSEAIEMFERALARECGCRLRAYSMVFMDIQMPEVDGVTATKAIARLVRESEGEEAAPKVRGVGPIGAGTNAAKLRVLQDYEDLGEMVHIVALTAFSSLETMEECRAVGMKELLGKPLDAKLLKEAVFHHFYRHPRGEAEAMAKAKAAK